MKRCLVFSGRSHHLTKEPSFKDKIKDKIQGPEVCLSMPLYPCPMSNVQCPGSGVRHITLPDISKLEEISLTVELPYNSNDHVERHTNLLGDRHL